MAMSNRNRALALITMTFIVGGVAGATLDRVWMRRTGGAFNGEERRRDAPKADEVEADQIPIPLEDLHLTPTEKASLHEIARRWRPKAAQVTDSIRATVSDLENEMFAEMLCAISTEKLNRYFAQLQASNASQAMIDKRFRLVRSNRCGSILR